MLNKRLERGSRYLTGFTLIAAIWQLLSMTGAGSFIPSPLSVLALTFEIFPQKLLPHTAASLARITVAVILAAVIAYPAGIVSALSGKADRVFSPLAYLLYPVPKIALLPLFLLLLGLGEISRTAVVFSVIVFQVFIAVRDSVKSIEKEYFISISILGGRKVHVFRYVIWPHTLPRLISSLRISTATALSVLFFAENFGTTTGLGFFIMDSWIRVAYREMLAGIVCISLLGISLFSLLDAAEKRLCAWNIEKSID